MKGLEYLSYCSVCLNENICHFVRRKIGSSLMIAVIVSLVKSNRCALTHPQWRWSLPLPPFLFSRLELFSWSLTRGSRGAFSLPFLSLSFSSPSFPSQSVLPRRFPISLPICFLYCAHFTAFLFSVRHFTFKFVCYAVVHKNWVYCWPFSAD